MDEFGVLVESIGFKAQGKSAPLSDLKTKSRNLGLNSGFTPKPPSNSANGSFNNNSGGFDAFDDVFGGPVRKPSGGVGFDLGSIFNGSSNNVSGNSFVYDDDDDIFGVMPKKSAQKEDLFGSFGGVGLGSNGARGKKVEKKGQGFDDLIPGFGGSSPSRNGGNAETSWSSLSSGHSAKSTSISADDPFVFLEQSSSQAYSSSGLFSEPLKKYAGKSSVFSSFDELEGFAMGKVQNMANEQSNYFQKERAESATQDLDSIFGMGSKPSTGSTRKAKTVDPVYDSLFQSRGNPVAKKAPPTSSAAKKASPNTNIGNDFSFIFGEVAPSSGEFQEIKGESEERRKVRLNHHMRTQKRMAKALAEKNQRDFQTQQEQEERHRIADTLDDDIKRWAAGKEGNLRALLSSLQDVLWPDCGWQPVSLTDLITSVSVKKVYYKATLCVHPDKVQQKGANIEQKYTAEKIFDRLKEAWNKFNAEEL
ncbi:auxilin-related protein 2 [Rhododendron vialii]|uniref:auxilin-related protein 2 n=1 Tax=Rhododendron vialii TaxID=182163 RepID=UPI00265D89BC|nr:auxilin-related protein 2 [Rhododendron vialii]